MAADQEVTSLAWRRAATRAADGRVRSKRGDPTPGSWQSLAPTSEAAVAAGERRRGGAYDSEDPAGAELRESPYPSLGEKRFAILGRYGYLLHSRRPGK